jgi:predicted RNase H-like HicB family nuclease
MSGRSKSTSAKNRARLSRPFHREVLKRAAEVAERYQVVLWFADGEYYGRGVEMPGVMADGRTPDACVAAVREALTAAVATAIELGEAPPPPAAEGARTEQVNIRLSPEEKLLLETAARQQGFRGVADYLRAAALGRRDK